MSKKNSYTLIIIDMQKYFETSQKKSVIKNCQKEIKKAMKLHNHIMFVEYDDCGKTDKRLTKLTKGYKNKSRVIKGCDNGSDEIYDKIEKWKLARKNLRVCGVNTDACVKRTVIGLCEYLPMSNIVLVKNACNTCGKVWHEEALNIMKDSYFCKLAAA